MKSSWRSHQKSRKRFLTISGNKSIKQIAPAQNLCQKSLLYILLNNFIFSSNKHHFEAIRKRYVLDKAKNSFEKHILQKNIWSKYCEKPETFWLKIEYKKRFIFHRLTTFRNSYMGQWARHLRQNNTCTLEKSGFLINFAEKFGHGQLRHCQFKKVRSNCIQWLHL